MASDAEFIEYENNLLNNLEKSFTPNQQQQYGEEVEYIKYLLDLLKKSEEKKTDKPETKKEKKERKKEEKEIKKDVQNSLAKLVNQYSLTKGTKITHTEVNPEEILNAKLVRASNKFYRAGGMDAQNYLKQEGIDDWNIDEGLSNDKGIVAFNEKTGKAVVAFRGTDKTNLNDLEADARIVMGSEGSHNHFTEAREQMRNAIGKYGLENVSTAGYSLGGNKSWAMGNEFGVSSKSFNPFIGRNIVNRPDVFKEGINHDIVKTNDDIASIQSIMVDGKNNTKVKIVETRGGKIKAMNPYQSHKLENFTSNEGRSGSMEDGFLHNKISDLANHAVRHGELRTFDEMLRKNKRIRVKGGLEPDQFLTEAEYEARGKEIGDKLQAKSLENQLTLGDRMEAKERTRQQIRGDQMGFRGDDFTGGLLDEEPDTLINRNQTRYQNSLDNRAKALPKEHLPNKPLSKSQYEEINTFEDAERFLSNYNQDGTPITEEAPLNLNERRPQNIRKQTQALEKSRPYLDNRSSRGGYKFAPEIDTLGNQIRALEAKVGVGKTRTLPPKIRADIKGLRNKTNPPLERPTNKSRALKSQTKRLENEIMEDTSQINNQGIEPSSGSFTEYVNQNNIEPSNHKKTLWEKSGGKLTEAEKVGYNPDELQTYSEEEELDNFKNKDAGERQLELEDHSKTQKRMETELNDLDNAGIRAGGASYASEVMKGIHPNNLILGYLTGEGAKEIMKKYVTPAVGKQGDLATTAETGGIAGGLASVVTGTPFLPEMVAGASGYVTQKYATEGIYKGLKSVGAGDDVAGVTASAGGGASAGFVAGALGAFTAGAVTGGEEGGLAGLGVASAETGTIGAIIGGLVGLGAYAKGRIFG